MVFALDSDLFAGYTSVISWPGPEGDLSVAIHGD